VPRDQWQPQSLACGAPHPASKFLRLREVCLRVVKTKSSEPFCRERASCVSSPRAPVGSGGSLAALRLRSAELTHTRIAPRMKSTHRSARRSPIRRPVRTAMSPGARQGSGREVSSRPTSSGWRYGLSAFGARSPVWILLADFDQRFQSAAASNTF